jgi:hypothetical protein
MRKVLIVTLAAIAVASLSATAVSPQLPSPSEYRVGEPLKKPATPQAPKAGDFKTTDWKVLIPKDWDPMKEFRGMDFGMLGDGDPRAMEMLNRMQEAGEKAPIEPSLDGARIRIPGFVVPLESKGREVSEFLLVPYFGACIHVPPPPANQIIHVVAAKPVKDLRAMDSVWVSGVLRTIHSENRAGMGMASAGYRMEAQGVAPYREK